MADLTIKERQEQVGIGTMVLSVDSATKSPCVVLKSDSVSMRSINPGIGIHVDDSGISFQGKMSFTSSGDAIVKGNYTENKNSYKPYTYQETIAMAATAVEQVYNQLASQGVDVSQLTKNGLGYLVTDVSAGPIPHVHTISMHHVHAVEPAYLHKLSPLLNGMQGILDSFKSFLGS